MNTITTTFRLTAMAAALLAAYGPVHAEDDEIAQLSRPDSFLSIGVGNWSNERFQQGIYDGMRKDGLYGLFDAEVIKRNEETGTWYRLDARNVGLENREVGVEVLRQGDIGASVEYSKIVRDHPLVIRSGLQGIGTEDMLISGAGANALPFHDVQLGTSRDQVLVGFYKNLAEGLDFKVSYRNEEKDGTRHWGLGSQALFLVEPIDSTTREMELVLDYAGEKLQVSGGYVGSWYDNHNSLVMGTVNGAPQPGSTQSPNPTPLSLPLDNQAHQFFVNTGYSFTADTRGTLKLSRSVATQDERIPAIDLTGVNAPFTGAPSRLDGEIVTTLAEVGLNTRATSKLNLSANLRYHDVDDRTPLRGFVGDNGTGEATVHNTPHSYTTNTGKFEASYRLPQRFKLIAGVDLKDQDRSAPRFVDERFVPFNEQLDETTYRVQLRRSMSDTINGSIAFLRSKRDGSSRVSPHDPEIFDAINPLHIADRTRNKWRLSLDWAPAEAVGLQFNVEQSRDDYDREDGRPFGLKDGTARLVSLDAHYALNDDWRMTAWLSHDTTRAKLLGGRWPNGSDEFADIDAIKNADLQDTGNSVGIGLRGAVGSKIKVGADLQWTRTKSEYDQDVTLFSGALYPTSGGVTAVELPDIENRLTRLSFFAQYALRSNADVRVDLIHERWRTDDWSWSFADGSAFTYGTTTDGTVVMIDPKQTSTFASVRYIYKFQ